MITYLGELGFRRQPGSAYKVARNGLATYDETWIGTPTASITFAQGDAPPGGRYPNVALLEWDITHTTGGELSVALHYEGVQDEGIENAAVEKIIDGSLTQEPIDTHPEFADIMTDAGDPFEKQIDGKLVFIFPNGAVFEAESRRFLYFTTYLPDAEGNPSFTEINEDAGTQNYLAPSLTYTESTIEEAWPNLDLLGYIDDPPDAPTLPGERNFLLSKVRARSIADLYYETTFVWMASGPRQWRPKWYTQPVA